MKTTIIMFGIAAALIRPGGGFGSAAEHPAASKFRTLSSGPPQEPVYHELPGFKKKCAIGDDYSFIYQFDRKPKMGMAVLKIELFDGSGGRTVELDITGRSGMPSMRGAHDSGETSFKLNKKGDYLLPVNIVMPGDWEVKLVFRKAGSVIYRARLIFNV